MPAKRIGGDWVENIDRTSGKKYYANLTTQSQETSWTAGAAAEAAAAEAELIRQAEEAELIRQNAAVAAALEVPRGDGDVVDDAARLFDEGTPEATDSLLLQKGVDASAPTRTGDRGRAAWPGEGSVDSEARLQH